ncbi:MAG: hypothetical protein LBT82_00625 [Oscillospiraceae bacterium]|nr:hypothetical protein [Oscillospiraceae bacterium]
MKNKKILFFLITPLILISIIIFVCLFNIKFNNKRNELNKKISFEFSKKANVKTNNIEFECEISRTKEEITNIKILSPKTLENIQFSWLGSHQEISFGSLSIRNEKEIVLNKNFSPIPVINKILNHASKLKNKHKKIKSNVDGLRYEITAYPNSKQIENIIVFSYFIVHFKN